MKLISSPVLLSVLLFVVNVNAKSVVDNDVAHDSEQNEDPCKVLCHGLEGVDCKKDSTNRGKFQCICIDNKTTVDDKKREEYKVKFCKSTCGSKEGVACDAVSFEDKVICGCKKDTESFMPSIKECRKNKCTASCGDFKDVTCKGDPFGEGDVECICNDDKKTFVKEKKECIENKCKASCGVSDDVKCKGDPFGKGDVECICNDDNKTFVKEKKECIENKCKASCSLSKDVTCEGDPFGKEGVECICKDDQKTFVKEKKECIGNKCKASCGESEDVICKGDPVGEEDVECICKDDQKTFVKEKKECLKNKCRASCGLSEYVTCKGNSYGEEDVECMCKDEKKKFVKEKKQCIDDSDECLNNPCQNGGTCYIVSNNTYICSCIEPYMGMKCEKNTGRLKAAVIVLSIIMVFLLISCLIVFCRLKRTSSGEYEPFKN